MTETQIVIVGAVVILIFFDIGIVVSKGVNESISWTVLKMSYKYPIIPFSLGVLCGHLFWSQ